MASDILSGENFHFDNSYIAAPRRFSFGELVQAGELCCEKGYGVPPHRQQYLEISYIVSGSGVFGVNGKSCEVHEGDIFINQPNEIHSIQASAQENLWFLYAAFVLGEDETAVMEELRAFYNRPIPQRLAHDSFNVKEPFMKILQEIYAADSTSEAMIQTCLLQMIILTYRTYTKYEGLQYVPPQSAGRSDAVIYSILRYVDSHIEEVRSVSGIADALGYSSAYLSHLFRDRTGMTLQNYVAYRKIECGQRLIEKGRYSITHISELLHFESVPSFSRAFRKVVGVSPSAFQRMCSPEDGRRHETNGGKRR
ncbi:AraC family transcriptional regulator [Lachnoclostridium sp. Marseille-P6806]|uniref:AraC family transcriptional regulator n=1 Tax=Lachnoclostridium sp. Marseille-P6806 TaxID=2364793 RepID=UPI0010308D16|nr:AraC family transcriptional regulator [Lachnoclostridium sp. Marseille-P6806]